MVLAEKVPGLTRLAQENKVNMKYSQFERGSDFREVLLYHISVAICVED